jgi:hypothetical protein
LPTYLAAFEEGADVSEPYIVSKEDLVPFLSIDTGEVFILIACVI